MNEHDEEFWKKLQKVHRKDVWTTRFGWFVSIGCFIAVGYSILTQNWIDAGILAILNIIAYCTTQWRPDMFNWKKINPEEWFK